MRIVGGLRKGQKLFPPHNTIRPTSDFVREALFNILGETVEHSRVLDLFAGTGAVGIEALSRGAESVVFVEHDPLVRKLIWKNLMLCEFRAHARIIPLPYETALESLQRKMQFQLVFADPPYGKGLGLQALKYLAFFETVAEAGRLIVETNKFEEMPTDFKHFSLESARRYGDTVLHFYRRQTSEVGTEAADQQPR